MKKVSEILGKRLICLCEGKNLGVVKNITFDKKLARARWLIVSDENYDNDFAVALSSVFREGSDAVVVKSESELVILDEIDTGLKNPINSEVFTTFGLRLGVVTDVILGETKWDTEGLILDSGEDIATGRVFSAGENTVIVLDGEEFLRVVPPKQKATKAPRERQVKKVKSTPVALPPHINNSASESLRQEETDWQPPKPEGQKKLIGDYHFLLGRKTNEDIFNKQNEKIIKKHTIITREIVEKARAAGKLIDLTVQSLPEHYVLG